MNRKELDASNKQYYKQLYDEIDLHLEWLYKAIQENNQKQIAWYKHRLTELTSLRTRVKKSIVHW